MPDGNPGPPLTGGPAQHAGMRRKFLRPRSRRTMKSPAFALKSIEREGETSPRMIYPSPATNTGTDWRDSQRQRLRHQDYRATAARGRARQSLERAKANLREARLALEKGDVTGAQHATRKALGIARATGAALPLRGTPIGDEAERTMQEAVALAMYLAETSDVTRENAPRLNREPAVEKALSRHLKAEN